MPNVFGPENSIECFGSVMRREQSAEVRVSGPNTRPRPEIWRPTPHLSDERPALVDDYLQRSILDDTHPKRRGKRAQTYLAASLLQLQAS